MDKWYLFFYITGIIFSVALAIIIDLNIKMWDNILIICVATTINVNAILHLKGGR